MADEQYEQVWVCPNCGQWGRDEFGEHWRPDNSPMTGGDLCQERPVAVNLRPFIGRLRENSVLPAGRS